MLKDPNLLLERYLAISRAIAGQMDFQTVLGQIAGEVQRLIKHDHMDLSIVLPHRRDSIIAFEVGMATEWGGKSNEPHPIAVSPIRTLLQEKEPYILTGDAWVDERFHFDGAFNAPIFDANLRSRLHVPLYVQGVVHGSLNISQHKKHMYTEYDLQIAQQVADLVAPYFYSLIRGDEAKRLALAEGASRGREEALRLGTLRLTEGMENERKRIGMDLHDQTLADLTRISRHTARISRKAVPVHADVTKIGTEITACISELRRIIEDTKPGVMELFGFAQAVEAQLERSVIGIVPAISTDVRDTASSQLDECPESLRTTLFRIVQEAINNSVKHGYPKKLSVTIEPTKDGICIAVIDDGKGARLDRGISKGGLDNMRVRAALISAKLDISDNAPNKGTRVTISIPHNVLNTNIDIPQELNAVSEGLS